MRPGILGLIAALGVSTACSNEPAHISVGRSDTVVVHKSGPIPVRVTTASGRLLPKVQPAFAILQGSMAKVTDSGSITCTGRGDARLRLTAGAATSEVTVQCRPIAYIVMQHRHSVDLVAGAPPVPLEIGAVGTDHKPLETISVAAVVRDTSIAVVRDGRIYPRKPGRTIITLTLGCQTWLEVTVHARPATPEAMQPHEMIGPCAPRPFNVARVRWRDRPRRSREQHARIRRRRR